VVIQVTLPRYPKPPVVCQSSFHAFLSTFSSISFDRAVNSQAARAGLTVVICPGEPSQGLKMPADGGTDVQRHEQDTFREICEPASSRECSFIPGELLSPLGGGLCEGLTSRPSPGASSVIWSMLVYRHTRYCITLYACPHLSLWLREGTYRLVWLSSRMYCVHVPSHGSVGIQ
jgi:hypothetical protein